LTSSLALGAVRRRVKCRPRHRRARNRASKSEFRVPTECLQREGHTGGNEIASRRQARRSPRAIRTSRNGTRENRETSPASSAVVMDRIGKPKAQAGHARQRGVEPLHSTYEASEQRLTARQGAEDVEGRERAKEIPRHGPALDTEPGDAGAL
jgi:hypothetical protein